MQTQCSVSGGRIDLYFHDYKLAIEIGSNCHSDRKGDYKIKGLKVIEQEICCEPVRINLVKEKFFIFDTINEIFRQIKQLSNQLILTKIG